MKKPELIERIDRKFNVGEVRIRSAQLSKTNGTLHIVLLTERILTASEREALRVYTEEQFPTLRVTVEIVASFADEALVKKEVIRFLKSDFPSVFPVVGDEGISVLMQEPILVKLRCPSDMIEYLTKQRFSEALQISLSKYFCNEVEFHFEEGERLHPIERVEEPVFQPVFGIAVTDVKSYIGDAPTETPAFISNVRQESDYAVLCGTFGDKVERKKPEREGKRHRGSENYYQFSLTDPTGKIQCVIFPSVANAQKMRLLREGEEVVVSGKVVVSSFSNEFNLIASKIATCKFPEKVDLPKERSRRAKDEYVFVQPKPFHLSTQDSFLAEKEEIDASVLGDGDFVIFDIETTGLKYYQDKIIEIGAVKISKGRFTESFSTLINPEIPIPQSATEVNHITDQMVKDCPTIEQVLPDFFKFTRGATMVAHNASFDMSFIRENGREQDFNFDNEVIDTLAYAKATVSTRNFKLETLCRFFGIENEMAHRAVTDAAATARVLICLKETELGKRR